MFCWTIIFLQLRPVKRKEIVAKTAEQLELPAELIDEIVTFYYNGLHKKMISGDYHRIQVPNLGTFVIKYKSLLNLIRHTENKIPYLDKIGTMIAYERKLERIKDLEKFMQLKQIMEEERANKLAFHKQKRESYENQLNRNLEEQGEDSGGSS